MAGVNKVILIGRTGKKPEVKVFDNGNKVVNFSLATSEYYKDRNTGEKIETTEWHNIAIFGNLVDVVEKYVDKGSLLYLEGKNKTRSWEKDGSTRYTTEVVCSQMTMLGGKSDSQDDSETEREVNRQRAIDSQEQNNPQNQTSMDLPDNDEEDELPF